MRSAGGLEIRVSEALGKAALIELARIYPDALHVEDLAGRAGALLARNGVPSPTEERGALEEGLVRLWRAGAIELRLHRPSLSQAIPASPHASVFARAEAGRRSVLSTALGTLVPLGEEDRRRVASGEVLEEPLAAMLARWGLLEEP
jgi:hypothetical protein